MNTDWEEAFREKISSALAAEYGYVRPHHMLQGCSAEEAARTAIKAIERTLEQFRMDALYRGSIIGAEASRERVREAYADGRTDPEDIIRTAGPPKGRGRMAAPRRVPKARNDAERCTSVANLGPREDKTTPRTRCGLVAHSLEESYHILGGKIWGEGHGTCV